MIVTTHYFENIRTWFAHFLVISFLTLFVLAELCHPAFSKVDSERPDVKDDYSLLQPVDQYVFWD